MQHEDETSGPDSLWRRLLADWLSEDGQAREISPRAADERQDTHDDLAA